MLVTLLLVGLTCDEGHGLLKITLRQIIGLARFVIVINDVKHRTTFHLDN